MGTGGKVGIVRNCYCPRWTHVLLVLTICAHQGLVLSHHWPHQQHFQVFMVVWGFWEAFQWDTWWPSCRQPVQSFNIDSKCSCKSTSLPSGKVVSLWLVDQLLIAMK
ncbi:uncharacterized protein LOC121990106 [Zingiber officinale]|uniref:uncharacterized protein LOC121990106 n=1 Tax=Zingiber officinale TaxID=94328 RepID=UPI001C4BF91F|nr:uncharacterized protein LOC121990106 [Zingiber officinale]